VDLVRRLPKRKPVRMRVARAQKVIGIVNVRLANTKVKRQDKTSLVKKEDTLILLMDAGY
ncbi:MAG: hypothetical protein DA330_04345, partial [Nitrososphaera sp.]|nr:hypothetical protein [Nitrososphaera sp.]